MTDTLIVIGAGNNPEQYLTQGYERVILLEPNPRLAKSLREKMSGGAAQVEELAVVTDAALNQLHEFNLSEVSSVRQPAGLKQLLAGLRYKTSHPVATLLPEDLCDRYNLSGKGKHKLVVQANGEEVNIILGLIKTGDLTRFQQLILAARHTAYYEGEKTIEDVDGPLKELGFEGRPLKQLDPDWPVWRFETNPLSKVVEDLKRELDEVRKESAQNEELSRKHKNLADHVKSQLSEKMAQHQELLSTFEKLQAENEQLLSEKQIIQNKNKKISELQAALSQEAERAKEGQQQNSDMSSRLQKLTTQVNEATEQLKSKDQRISELNKSLEERNYKLELMRQEVVKVQAQIELIKDVVVREKAF